MPQPAISPHVLGLVPDGTAGAGAGQADGPGGPGAAFARAVTAAGPGGDVALDLPLSLPLTFPFFAERPRYTVRHLLPVSGTDGQPVPYLREPPPAEADGRGGTTYQTSPESSYRAMVAHLTLTEVSVAVPLPDGLTGLPDLLATFVDRRVVVRLCTVENQTLLHGSADGCLAGLLTVPGLRREQGRGDVVADLARAAALVEDTGGSCDGVVVHPDVYWALVAGGALERFTAAGVRVARTRMISRACALLGDFRAAATLVDPARSRLRLAGGRDPGERVTIEAAVTIGLAVHLPQHLLLLTLHPDR